MLTGLAERDLAALASSYGVDATDVTTQLHRVSGGNPLFARELLLDESTRTALVAGRDPQLPRGVRAVLSRRLAGLGEHRDIVTCAAFGPQPVLEVALVAAALNCSHSRVASAFDAAHEQGWLIRVADGTLRFAHDLVRLAALEDLTSDRRAALHRGWARALECVTDFRMSIAGAFHAFAADPTTSDESLRDRALAAGCAALHRMLYQPATALFELAAAADERAGRYGGAARAVAHVVEALTFGGDPKQGAAAAARAVAFARRAADPHALANAAIALGLRRQLGTTDPSLIALLEEALGGLAGLSREHVEDAVYCAVEARLASALQPFADPTRALHLGRSSIERARATGDERLLAGTIHSARPAFRILDDLYERLNMDSELLYLATKLGDPFLAAQARARLCFIAIERGDAPAFESHLDAYATLADELQTAQHELGVTSFRALRATIRGEVDEAHRRIAEVERARPRWTASIAVTAVVDPVIMLRAALAIITGDADGYTGLASAPTPPLMRSMFALLGAVRLGRMSEVAELCSKVAERVLSPATANFTFRSILSNAIVALRDVEHARRIYPMLDPYRGRHVIWTPFSVYDGSIDRLRAGLASVIGDRDAASKHFEDAHGVSAGCPCTAATRCIRDRNR